MRVILLCLVLAAACVSRPAEPRWKMVAEVEPAAKQEEWQPQAPRGNPTKFDWIRLNTNEWLKGKLKVVRDDQIQFRSDKLKDLSFDWEDIKELRSSRSYDVALANRETYRGKLIMRDGRLLVGTRGGVREFQREELLAIVPTGAREIDRWSGSVGIGFTARSGNTNQTDVTSDFHFIRRTPFSKIDLRWLGNFSKVNDVETVNNQRFTGSWNLYLSPKWFVTPAALDVFRDPFQNIGIQVTPTAGGGYHLIRKPKVKWDLTLGLGVRYSATESAAAGEDASNVLAAIVPGTTLDWDITSKTDFALSYSVNIGVPDTGATNQYLLAKLSVDVVGDLELTVTAQWNHIGEPQPAGDGTIPLQDDFWLTFGVAWEF